METTCVEGALDRKLRSEKGSDYKTARGFGIVDGAGVYVDDRSHATSCGLCPAGTSSTALQDQAGCLRMLSM